MRASDEVKPYVFLSGHELQYLDEARTNQPEGYAPPFGGGVPNAIVWLSMSTWREWLPAMREADR